MADQAAAASRPYGASHFGFVKQKPRHDAAQLLVASIPKQSSATGTGPRPGFTVSDHSTSSEQASASQATRCSTVASTQNAPNSSKQCKLSSALCATRRAAGSAAALLPQHVPLSAGVAWKQPTRTGSKPKSIGDAPLLSRLAKLTSSSNSVVPPAAAAGSHIAGVLPAHGPKERDHTHSPSQQTQHGLIPTLSAPMTELLSWPKSSAQSVRPSLQPTSFASSHAQQELSHSIKGPDTHPPAVYHDAAQPLFDGTTALTEAEEPVWGAEVKPLEALSPATHTQQPQPPCASLSVLAEKPKSSSRSRLRLQRPPASAGPTPDTMRSPSSGANSGQAADSCTQSMPKSKGNLALAQPLTQPRCQLHSLKAAARGCPVSKNQASLPLDHPVDQRGHIQQVHPLAWQDRQHENVE